VKTTVKTKYLYWS